MLKPKESQASEHKTTLQNQTLTNIHGYKSMRTKTPVTVETSTPTQDRHKPRPQRKVT